MLTSKRARVAVGLGSVLIVAAAGTAYAGTSSGTTVTIAVGSAGTRQLDVLDLTGNPLTNLALQANVPSPFRVRVTDANISDLTAGFSVSAVMNNLYQQTGTNSYDYSKQIPSSDVSINYGSNPLNAFGVSLDDLPQFSLSGVIPSCSQMVTDGVLTLSDLTTTATNLCSLLSGLSGGTETITNLDVTGTLTSVTPTVTNLLDLPFQISGNQSGAFTNPDFANGIGVSDPNASTTSATARQVMQGVPGMTTTLASEVQSAIALPSAVTSADGTGSLTKLSDVLSAMSNSTFSTLATDIGLLSQSEQVALINKYLSGTLLGPVLADVSNVAGTYNAFPMLTATPPANTPAGSYAGTMTVTMVQQ